MELGKIITFDAWIVHGVKQVSYLMLGYFMKLSKIITFDPWIVQED